VLGRARTPEQPSLEGLHVLPTRWGRRLRALGMENEVINMVVLKDRATVLGMLSMNTRTQSAQPRYM
jgi:hypothetical protein